MLECVCSCVVQSDYFLFSFRFWRGFPSGSDSKASVCNAGDQGSIPGLGRSPGEGNGSPLQYSCMENPMDRGAWQAIVHGVVKSRTRLSDFTHFRLWRVQQPFFILSQLYPFGIKLVIFCCCNSLKTL